MTQENFLEACKCGDMLSAKEIALHPTINIYDDNNHAFRVACKNNHLPVVKWLVSIMAMDVSYYDKSFRIACQDGHLALAKFLLLTKPTLDISSLDNHAFRLACQKNHLRLVKWLTPLITLVDSSYYESAFRVACQDGHLALAKFLLLSKPTLDICSLNNKAFRLACRNNHLRLVKWLTPLITLVDSSYYESAFRVACQDGHLALAKFLLLSKPTLDICSLNNKAFRLACRNNHLRLVKWLTPLITLVDNSCYEKSFRIACQEGHLDITKVLLLTKPTLDIYSNNNNAIRMAYGGNHVRVSNWLWSLNPHHYNIIEVNIVEENRRRINHHDIEENIIEENIIEENYRRLNHNIKKTLPMHSEIIYIECSDEDKECTICKTHNINLQTNCKHNFCTECISEWYDLHKTCPYCRADITQIKKLVIT